ncbi:MAG: DoxX family protein [Pseudomonadota bacterium]
MIKKLVGWHATLAQSLNCLEPFALLGARLVIARVFLLSGLAKWNGFFSFEPTTYDLFLYEFFCPEEARPGALILCKDVVEGTYSETMQWWIERFAELAGVMEIALPLLLIAGLFSRVSAIGLLIMTLVIEFFVFPDAASFWGSHVWWGIAALIVIARGPGLLSLDAVLGLDRPKGTKVDQEATDKTNEAGA